MARLKSGLIRPQQDAQLAVEAAKREAPLAECCLICHLESLLGLDPGEQGIRVVKEWFRHTPASVIPPMWTLQRERRVDGKKGHSPWFPTPSRLPPGSSS